nr:wax ester/triacylglycerol synthase family O-acyltransferase [Nocardia neocaledoniensis]
MYSELLRQLPCSASGVRTPGCATSNRWEQLLTRVSDLDAQFIALERGTQRGHYLALVHLGVPAGKPAVTIDDIRDRISQRIHLLPPLRWKLRAAPLGLEHPSIVEVDVDIDSHVTEVTIDQPGDDRSLARAASAVLAQPLDRSRPLWRVVVFSGLQDRRVALGIVLHHATIDGVSAGRLFSSLYDDAQDLLAEVGTEIVGREEPAAVASLLRGLGLLLVHPFASLGAATRALPHLDEHPTLRSLPGVLSLARFARAITRKEGSYNGSNTLVAPVTPFTTALSDSPSTAFGSLDFADILAIKKATSMTVNDVVMALCGGALRRWLDVHDQLPSAPLLAFVPVTVRGAGELYGNRFSSMIARLPTDVEDPVARLDAARQEMGACKARGRSVPDSLLVDTNSLLPPPLLPLACRAVAALVSSRRIPPPVNLVISNIPGSPVRLGLAGAPVLAQYPLSLIFSGVGLNITVVSYMDKIDVGIVAAGSVAPDAWELLQDIRAELKELVSAVSG